MWDVSAEIREDRDGRKLFYVSSGTCIGGLRYEWSTSLTVNHLLHSSLEVIMFGTSKQRNGGMNALLNTCGQKVSKACTTPSSSDPPYPTLLKRETDWFFVVFSEFEREGRSSCPPDTG